MTLQAALAVRHADAAALKAVRAVRTADAARLAAVDAKYLAFARLIGVAAR